MAYRVVVTDHTFDDLDIERGIFDGIDVDLIDGETSNEPVETLAVNADGLIVMYEEIRAPLIERLTKCRVISRTGIGVDNVDIQSATDHGIYVTNVPDYCIPEVADHTLALALALTRKIVDYTDAVKAGGWDVFAGRPIHRLVGQTWGLVGFGSIGQAVADRVRAHEMDILTYDPYVPDAEIRSDGAEPVDSLTRLLTAANIVSIHVPLTPETDTMLSSPEFDVMRDSAVLINCSRGGIIDEPALAEALANGDLAGAGLDVLAEEPPGQDHDLLDEDRAIITPHAAFYSEESVIELREKAARNVREALVGDVPRYLINDELAT